MALPFFSVDTLEEAQDLQLLVCKLNYDGRYIVPGFSGELSGLDDVAEKLDTLYRGMKENGNQKFGR